MFQLLILFCTSKNRDVWRTKRKKVLTQLVLHTVCNYTLPKFFCFFKLKKYVRIFHSFRFKFIVQKKGKTRLGRELLFHPNHLLIFMS